MAINKQHKGVYRYRFFFIWVSFHHCVQFLQQLHVCVRNDWMFLPIMTPWPEPAIQKNKSTLRFHHLSLTYKLYIYTFTYIINMWKKILSNCDTQLRQHAECKYWFSTRTYATYARARHTCIQTVTHTHFFKFLFLYTLWHILYKHAYAELFFFPLSRAHTRAHTHTNTPN